MRSVKVIEKIRKKVKTIKYYEEKKRLLVVMLIFFCSIFAVFKLFQVAYASYESKSKINMNIQKALYILEEGQLSFSIDPSQIVPSEKPYVYKFSISNFTESKQSDVDIEYSITLRTTTNLPLTYKLYRNEVYDDSTATNIIKTITNQQDVDGAWYNIAPTTEKYTLLYTEKVTDVYTLVINFPKEYKAEEDYADNIENIIIELNSSQLVQ